MEMVSMISVTNHQIDPETQQQVHTKAVFFFVLEHSTISLL